MAKLKRKVHKLKNSLKNIRNRSDFDILDSFQAYNWSNRLNIFQVNFKNAKKGRPTWNAREKSLALALYKRGPNCYNFLKQCIPLPSRTTLNKMLKEIEFDIGIHRSIFLRLSQRVSKMKECDRIPYYCLMKLHFHSN